MELVKQVSEMTYEDAKEALKGYVLIGLIRDFTGYKLDDLDDEEAIDGFNKISAAVNAVFDSILEKTDTNELKELLEEKENMVRFKRKLYELMEEIKDW